MRIAAIDIGSNSVHMIAADARAAGGLDLIDKAKDFVRLGDGVFETGLLREDRVEAAVQAIDGYARIARSIGAERVVTVATSATRDAENGEDFVRRLRDRTGVDARVISGEEEARLIYLAVLQKIDLHGKRALVVDVGGGSVELSLGTGEQIAMAESLDLGVRRLRDTVGAPGKLDGETIERVRRHVERTAESIVDRVHEHGVDLLVGTSGTLKTLGELTVHPDAGWKTINSESTSLEDLEAITKRLVKQTPDERVEKSGVERRRADTIHLGALLITTLMKRLGMDAITFSDASLREGVIQDHLRASEAAAGRALTGSLQRRSVFELGRRYGADGPRARHVRTLALELFDRTRELHQLDEDDRRFLEYASELHRVGHFVSYRRNHKHARYLIRHARMPGFTNDEVRFLALLVRYHRKAKPKKKHKRYKKLSKSRRRAIRVLAGLLRVAIALDRKGGQTVTSALVEVHDDRVEIYASGESVLDEVRAARSERALLERSLDREVVIQSGVDEASSMPHLSSPRSS
ncbi:MAG: Ppx/GppA phosphatase family protein [Deltaproteobacteria bacterium]